MPDTSLSIWGFLGTLAMWATGKQKQCGLEQAAAVRGAQELLSSLVRCSASEVFADSKPFALVFDRNWMPSWPRPELASDHFLHVLITIDHRGVFMKPWKDIAQGPIRRHCNVTYVTSQTRFA